MLWAQKPSLRQELTINHGWKFRLSDGDAGLTDPNLTQGWESVNLPHTYNAQDAFDNVRGYYQGKAFYSKKLVISSIDTNKFDYFLKFKGANHTAKVWFNGNYVGGHVGGYTSFMIQVNRYLKSGDNHLGVEVDNSNTREVAPISADFTFYGGLYRDVYWVKLPKARFSTENFSSGIRFKTAFANGDLAQIEVNSTLSPLSKGHKVQFQLLNGKGETVWLTNKALEVNKSGIVNTLGKLIKPELWSPKKPNLYRLIGQLVGANGEVVDEVSQKVGIRTFKFDPDSGFYLNGEYLKLFGANRHQDYEGLGNALTKEFHRQDALLLKKMGANFLRIAHYPQDDELLKACDELGILVWEEIPIVNEIGQNNAFRNSSLQQLREMIAQHFNHPSVIIWGYMNEVLLKKGKTIEEIKIEELATLKLAKSLDSLSRTLDPTRFTGMALHNSERYNSSLLADVPQVVGWNLYHGWYHDKMEDFGPFMDDQKKRFPKRNLIITEYGPGYDPRIKTNHPLRYDFSRDYGQNLHHSYYSQINARRWIAGATLWNLVDFGSEGRKETMPHINNKGLVSMNRTHKDVYYFYKAALNHEAMVHIAARDFPKYLIKVNATEKIKKIPLRIYSNCVKVSLFINDKPVGYEKVKDFMAEFEIPVLREKTQIVAVGYNAKDAIIAEDVFNLDIDFQTTTLKSKVHNWNELYINVGSYCQFFDVKTQKVWIEDQPYFEGSFGYVGGKFFSQDKRPGSQDYIVGSDLTPIYQTRVDSLNEYRLDVPDGTYQVQLFFAELDKKASKVIYDLGVNNSNKENERPKNRMSISLNDQVILPDFCPLDEAGPYGAIPIKFEAKADNGKGLRFQFKAISGTTFLNGLSISKD